MEKSYEECEEEKKISRLMLLDGQYKLSIYKQRKKEKKEFKVELQVQFKRKKIHGTLGWQWIDLKDVEQLFP